MKNKSTFKSIVYVLSLNRIASFIASIICMLIFCSGCASFRSSNQADSELKLLQDQSSRLIEQARMIEVQRSRTVQANDLLHIEVWMQDRSTQFKGFPLDKTVPSTCEVFIPYFGLTIVSGKTDKELADLLSEQFNKILKNSLVVVTHSQNHLLGDRYSVQGVRHISIMGWVGRPGLYPIESYTKLNEAIAGAGGIADFGDLRNMYLVRGSVEKPTVLRIDLAKIMKGKDLTQNVVLEANDAIYVPPIKMWMAYDFIRKALLPITGVRDAVWTASSPVITQGN